MNQLVRITSTLLFVVVLLAGVALPAAAQDGPMGVNCNGLSDADCTILMDAAAAMGTMSSFTVPQWSFAVDLAVGEQTMNLSGSGSARLVIPPVLLAMMSDMPTDTMDVNALLSVYQMIDAAMIMEMIDTMGGELVVDTLNMEATGEMPTTVSGLNLMYTDRGLYMHMMSPNGAEAWFGQQIEITDAMVEELDTAIDEMQVELEASLSDPALDEAMMQMEGLMGLVAPLTEVFNAHTTTVRGGDMAMMGQTMMPFTTTLDLKAVVNDPALASALVRMLEDPMLAEMMGGEMEDMGVDVAQLQMLLAIMATFVNEGSVSSTMVVGEDGFVHQMSMDMVIDINLAILGDPEVPGVRMTAGYEITFDAINSTTLDDLTPPADYHPLFMQGDFLMGSPSMIDANVALGDTYSSAMGYDGGEDTLALSLAAGDNVLMAFTGDEYPYIDVYGPDGFEVASFNTYYDDADMTFSAEADGVYLIVVESYWELTYDITFTAQ